MRLRMLVLTAALLWPVSVFSQTKEITAFIGGNDLFHVCSDGRDAVRQICEAYVEGVADTFFALNALKANGLAICIPEGVKSEQAKDVVVQYLTAHPESRHRAAAVLALLALQANAAQQSIFVPTFGFLEAKYSLQCSKKN